ncbi:hypothetical protein [Hippea maritima]|uniref:Uncharacterized protein n=1 Tax=Hippea maritima (strain ATCC 700847 / DSM 10411 / MH2) TaxID=760142 RepID=F2LWT3_HIPMA|nr:hypothetical protein [Hippea maritima]AEA33061.1 hypothetical protein Hipma_0081 [Hippea maritima DSM 10411]
MMNRLWVRVDMVGGECYIGSLDYYYEEGDDLMMVLEDQAYLGLKIDNVHKCKEVEGKLLLEPIDAGSSIYKSSMIIMNTDNIITIKFLKEDSSIVKELEGKITKKEKRSVKASKNILQFKPVKRENV